MALECGASVELNFLTLHLGVSLGAFGVYSGHFLFEFSFGTNNRGFLYHLFDDGLGFLYLI